MSTNATIKIEGVKFAKIFKYWDGYPSATQAWLVDFNEKFEENRGNDPEYKFAQLLRSSYADMNEYSLDANRYTGWGVIPYKSGPGDYEYTLHLNGRVTMTKH